MMSQGAWVLMIILYGAGHHEITLVPYMDNNGEYVQFANRQLCEAWKGRESLEHIQPLTCVQGGGEV